MTFLQLVQRLRQECQIPGTGPSTVVAQTGQFKKLVDWTIDAYRDIQQRHRTWRWLRSTFSVNTVADDDTYAASDCTDTRIGGSISRFSHWWPLDDEGYDNIKSYLSASGVGTEGFLNYLPWSGFRSLYRIGTQNSSTPAHVTIDPQRNLVLGPKPNGIYVVSGEYQMSPQILDDANDADVPEMPEDYHLLIVWYAMEKYGANSVAAEIFARAVRESNRMLSSLELDQLPQFVLPEPLA